MASIHSLPFEILASILERLHEEATVELTDTWLAFDISDIFNTTSMMSVLSTMCDVSPAWKQVAISAPQLWSVIPLLNLDDSPLSALDFIERSAHVPLTLLVDLSEYTEILLTAFHRLARTGGFARIANMSVILGVRGANSHTCSDNLHVLLLNDMPALQHLSFCDGILHLQAEGWKWVENHNKQLRTLLIGVVDDMYRLNSAVALRLPWPRIRLLRIQVASFHLFRTLFTGPFPALMELHIGSEHERYQNYQQLDLDISYLFRACPNIERLVCYEYMFNILTLVLTALCTRPPTATRLSEMTFHCGLVQKSTLQRFFDARGALNPQQHQDILLDHIHFLRDTRQPLAIPRSMHVRYIDNSGTRHEWGGSH